jgi:hypothetical protein
MEFFNRYTYLPEVRADGEDRLWSRFPADHSYHASDFRRDEENNGSLTKGSNNEPDPYQFFAVNLQGFKPKCDYNQSLEDTLRLQQQALDKRNIVEGQNVTYKDINGEEWINWVAPEHCRQHNICTH